MSVYQVNEYCICTARMKLTENQKKEICEMLTSHGFSTYAIHKSGEVTVEGFDREDVANEIESKIYEIAGI